MGFKNYRRKEKLSELRPFVFGEDLSGVSVSDADVTETESGESGGYIARNPRNHSERWYIGRVYFNENFDPVPVDGQRGNHVHSREEFD